MAQRLADAPIAAKTETDAPARLEVPLVVAPEVKPAVAVWALPWVIAGIGVAVAGAAVGTYFGVRANQGGCGVATIGCLDARR